MFAARPLTLGELESVLSLKGREQSLRPLSNVIIDQYSSLLRVEGKLNGASKEFDLKSRVLLVSDSVKHFLDAPVKDGTGMESKVWDEVEAVNESEVRIVRQFLESVCDASLFQRFGFEDLFVAKLSRSSLKVRVDVESAHCKILKACLEAICSPDKPEMDFLLDYAVEPFPYHLEQIDLSSVHPQDKMSIGPYLVALFDDVEIIKRRWSTGYTSVSKLRQVWFYKDTLVHASRPISFFSLTTIQSMIGKAIYVLPATFEQLACGMPLSQLGPWSARIPTTRTPGNPGGLWISFARGAVGPTGPMRMTSMCAKLAQVFITTKPARTNCGRGRSQWRSAAMITSCCMFRPMIPSPKRGSAKAMSAWAGRSSVSRHGLSGLDRNGG